MDIPFPVGELARQVGPLARYLPPFNEGTTTSALTRFGSSGDVVLDPFGASPVLVREAALSGRAVVVAANNPVTRFVLQHTLKPFAKSELKAALARLASAPKDGGRLEHFILDLYQTRCSRCAGQGSADYFVWQRGAEHPSERGYTCEKCHHTAEEPTTAADHEKAREFAGRSLQYALALEQVAPRGDPDRRHVEAALAVYPGRAIFGLMTLLNKATQLRLDRPMLAAAQALMLSAMDSTNAMWGHPEGRSRPRQLSTSPRYREMNLWRGLERAVSEWALGGQAIQVDEWPAEQLPAPGSVAIFAGPLRDLVSRLPKGAVQSVLTALPRPNQAYWALSALWAAWLWGREVALPIRASLRRRRYEWSWHAGAIRSVASRLAGALEIGTPVLAMVAETEPGFLAAGLSGFDAAGFRLTGRALRLDAGTAALTWRYGGEERPTTEPADLPARLTESVTKALLDRGEPALYPVLHAAALTDLASEGGLAALWEAMHGSPLATLASGLESALQNTNVLQRLDERAEIESGSYWLAQAKKPAVPVADRLENLVLEALREHEVLPHLAIDEKACKTLPGLLTPDDRLLRACLRSYADLDRIQGTWRLREQETAESRQADCDEIKQLLSALGRRLGFTVKGKDPITWEDGEGGRPYAFRVQETAVLGEAMAWKGKQALTLVLPGGRSSLVAQKCRRDARMGAWLHEGARVVKFRHIRRLAAEDALRREHLHHRLALDPPLHQEPQMPLL
jgi:hypothetical protein